MPEFNPIPESLRLPLGRFQRRIFELGGDDVLAWTLFGAVASGTFDVTRHAVRSVLVLRRIDLHLLKRLGAEGPNHADARLAVPVVMTSAFLDVARDTFPLELIEIQQQHWTAFGDDYFHDLEFEDGNVRLQCEREMEVLALALRQGLMATAGQEQRLALLAREWSEGLWRTLRGMLWLKGHKLALAEARVLDEVERIVRRPLPGIRRAVSADCPPDWEAFQQLYADVEALGTAVDGW